MHADRYNRVDRIAQAAVELPANKIAAYLDSVCGGDPDLRREVESLILYQQKANSFLEETALQRAAELIAGSRDESIEGQTIANYKIESRIGAGGMGEVYLAQDTRLDRKVAIKFLPQDVAAGELARKRLVREARAAAKLDHPNICAVHEVNQEASLTFIVMQYVDGETLSSRIERTPLAIADVLDIAVQVADALSEAHSRGIIHRDIKPANIMLTARGQVKVLDFGLAKIVRREDVTGSAIDTESRSEAGVIAGTVPYMSPEQLRAETIDARSDIFSFGVVLYEMITGKQPFARGSSAETIAAIQMVEPASLRSDRSEVPEALACIVQKSLQKDREKRYQTAKDLLIDLNDLKHRLEFTLELERSFPPDTVEEGKRQVVKAANDLVDTGGLAAVQTQTTSALAIGVLQRQPTGSIIAAATLILAIATVIYLRYFPASSEPLDSIAILPLVNGGNDVETDYLSDGITESLINSLSQFPRLRVVARTTAFHYKGKEIDPRQVGRDLDVRAVLTGKLFQRGDTLEMQVELVETNKGSQIWGEQYNRKASNWLAVRQELAREIIEGLRFKLGGEDNKRLTKGDTASAEAYQSYLRGRHIWKRQTAVDIKKAIECFQQAIEKDPNYALAYVGLADCYGVLEDFAGSPTSEILPKARAAVERALQIDDSLGEAHSSLAHLEAYSWNKGKAEREYRRAIELNPNYAQAHHWYSVHLCDMWGRFDDAMVEIRLAQRLDPLSPSVGVVVGKVYAAKGELNAAVEAYKKVLELEPNFAEAHRLLGFTYQRQGWYEEAIAESEKAVEASGRASKNLARLGVCYAVAGEKAKALAILKELEEKYNRREALGYNLAQMYAALGEKEKAFAWLERDLQARTGGLARYLAYSQEGNIARDVLSNDPRWNDLLRRTGLPLN